MAKKLTRGGLSGRSAAQRSLSQETLPSRFAMATAGLKGDPVARMGNSYGKPRTRGGMADAVGGSSKR